LAINIAAPVRIVVNHVLNDLTDDPEFAAARLEKGDVMRLLDKAVVKQKLPPTMLEKAMALAGERMRAITESAIAVMTAQRQDEIERLMDLRAINDHVGPNEIEVATRQKSGLACALAKARIRPDAVRLILRAR
jgi:hypothetical protein